ncbi:putative stress-responsive transcriptional regulator [Moraxella catarrhalis]|nr:putative stress-responsive transcriptional regulator [Moraxella catarrhalis]OAV18148.1 putative stress-responsive transcriptional regulator [Moraxella catarrhalis]
MGKFMPRLIKLHRSKNHRMIAGVMGGIAEYLGWSPNMVRIAFVIISSLSAAVPGILIYLVLWLIMPNATPNSYATNLVQYDR